tara:strand:+ start:403 stop:1719 length:1317 start_codon:yes stop_codon:yes gene_type:complete
METKTKTTPADESHPHSIFGASGAKRWRLCPGSVNLIKKAKAAGQIPEREESEFAAEGTEAHNWAEKVLTGQVPIQEVPEEFRLHLEGYIGHCSAIAEMAIASGGRVYNEATVPLFYRPQDQGTLDFAAVTKNQIHFVDLKYGVGVKVDALDNEQLAIYLLSLVAMLEIDEMADFPDDMPVSLAIYQPRHYSFDGEPDTWETTVRDLKDFGIDIEADYQKAKDAEGVETELNPSNAACQFCDVKGVCTARARRFLDPMIDFEDEVAPAIKAETSDTLTPEQVAFFILNGKAIKKVLDDVEKQERARLEQGGTPHGVKLVAGNLGPKKWVDEKAAETFLKGQLSVDERYQPRKVITAPQAFGKLKTKAGELSTIAKAKLGLLDEEAAKKSKTECLFHRAIGAPALVPADDERPALNFATPADDFADEPDTGDCELDSLM